MVVEKRLTETQKQLAKDISLNVGVSYDFAEILVARGVDSPDAAKRFLRPDKSDLQPPLWHKGVADAVERITAARDNSETVVIYGDYDADGISAVTVLYKCLKIFGLDEVYTVIPERRDGYGLSAGVYERVIDECNPDLLITVDCGISGANEVEELKDLGVDVIVTDHHELPAVLPDCTVINCHIKSGLGNYENLCGAGVAYKLGRALIGEKADEFLDMVAVATIADSMPLTGENRVIVSEGIKLFKSGKMQKPLKVLAEVSEVKDFTAQSLAFSIIPRINAAGRMGDAYTALELFMSTDEVAMREAARKLNRYNAERQAKCDALYKSAKEKYEAQGYSGSSVVLSGDGWDGGIIGIVAARLAEEYQRPAVLLSGGEVLHGSARSSTEISVYNAINSVKDLTVTFGGHAQAAGVGIRRENLDALRAGIDKYVRENYDVSAIPTVTEVDKIIDKPIDMVFARELSLLEPCGAENKKPIFAVKCESVSASPIKIGSPHVAFKTVAADMLWFNGSERLPLLNSHYSKYVIFEPNVSSYMGVETLKGYARSVELSLDDTDSARAQILDGFLRDFSKKTEDYRLIDEDTAKNYIEKARGEIYGTLFIASGFDVLKRYDLTGFDVSLLRPSKKSNVSVVCVGFSGELPKGYERVVYLDRPLCVRKFDGAETLVCDVSLNSEKLSASRDILGKIFVNLRCGNYYGNALSVAIENDFGVSKAETLFALYVFKELGIIGFDSGRLTLNVGVKANLGNSEIYKAVENYGRNT